MKLNKNKYNLSVIEVKINYHHINRPLTALVTTAKGAVLL